MRLLKTRGGLKMKKLKIVFFLLSLILISSAFVKFPVAELGFSPYRIAHRDAAKMIDTLYPGMYDSTILISFQNTSNFKKDPSVQTYYTYSYREILHPEDSLSHAYNWYWGGFNGNIPVVPPNELLDSLTAAISRDYSPFQITIGPNKEETILVKIVSDSVVEPGPFRLFTFILQNKWETYYSPPEGYNWNARIVLPNGHGLKFTIAPNETLEFNLPFLYSTDWDFFNLEVACFIDDSATHEILQGAHGEMPIPEYVHSVYTVGPVSYLINPGDSAKFRIKINNFGFKPDTFAVKSSLSSPAGWTTEFCTSETSFADSGFVLADTNKTKELSVYIKSDSLNPGIGTVEITLVSQGGKVHKIYFSCASGGPVLVVDDAPSISGKYYRQVLDSLNAEYFYLKRTDMFITPVNMQNFDIVIWFTGSSNSSTLLESDKDAIAHFLEAGGKLFISGAQIGTDLVLDGTYTDPAFYKMYLRASGDPEELLESSPILEVSGVAGNIISYNLSFNITGGDGANNSLISNVITPYDAQAIFYYGASANFCAGVRLRWGFKVIYLPFCFEAIDNFEDRCTLMKRILNWYGYYPGFISDMTVEQPVSLSIKSYPNPFNAICEIQYTIYGDGFLEIYDINGRKIKRIIVKENGIYIWDASSQSSGVYLVKLGNSENVINKKVYMLKLEILYYCNDE